MSAKGDLNSYRAKVLVFLKLGEPLMWDPPGTLVHKSTSQDLA